MQGHVFYKTRSSEETRSGCDAYEVSKPGVIGGEDAKNQRQATLLQLQFMRCLEMPHMPSSDRASPRPADFYFDQGDPRRREGDQSWGFKNA